MEAERLQPFIATTQDEQDKQEEGEESGNESVEMSFLGKAN